MQLVQYRLLDKSESMYQHGAEGKEKFVPTAIYIYTNLNDAHLPNVTPTMTYVEETPDFVFLKPDDDSCNMLVKRWGTVNTTGRLVSTDSSCILEQVEKFKTRKYRSITNAPNFHLKARNVSIVAERLQEMEDDLRKHFAYARNCSNVNIRPEEFITLYARPQ